MSNGIVRVVATADNHLNRFYDRMTPQKLSLRRKYLRDGFKAAVDYAIDWSAHLFLMAGDLFDQPDPRNVDRNFVASCLGRLKDAGIKIYAIGGNHDTPRQSTEQGGAAPQEVYQRLHALTYFDDPDEILTDTITIGGLRVAIGGLSPNPALAGGSDPLEGLTWKHDGDLGILLLHGQVEGYELPDTTAPVIKLSSLAALPATQLYVVGDIHRPAMKRLGQRLLVIPGATERMTFGENPDVPGFVVVELNRDGVVSYDRIKLKGQPRAELKIRVADLDLADPFSDLVAKISEACTPETMVKLYLEGLLTRERYHALQLRQLYDTISPKVFHFTLDTYGLAFEDERHETARRGVRLSQQEELRFYAQELLAANLDSEEQSLLNQALQEILNNY